MDKLKRIVSDRKWNHSSEPLKVFDGRLREMILLLSSVISQEELEDSIKLEARKQYIIMLVCCYETYLRDTFFKSNIGRSNISYTLSKEFLKINENNDINNKNKHVYYSLKYNILFNIELFDYLTSKEIETHPVFDEKIKLITFRQ